MTGSRSDLSFWCGSGSWFLFNADPESWSLFDADPDPDFYLMRIWVPKMIRILIFIWWGCGCGRGFPKMTLFHADPDPQLFCSGPLLNMVLAQDQLATYRMFYVPETHIMYFIRRGWFPKCSEEGLLGGGGGGVLLVWNEMKWHSRKKSRFTGSTLSNAPHNDVAPLKTIMYRAIKTTGTLIVKNCKLSICSVSTGAVWYYQLQ